MPADPSDAIRDALHADEIDYAELRQPTMRAQSPSGTRAARVLTGSAAAVLVAAVAVVVSLVATSGGSGQAAGQRDAMTGVTGYRWDVTGVRDAHGRFTVPDRLSAHIGFARTGVVTGNDGVNTLSARYRVTGTGYRVSDGATTVIGTVGDDPVRDRVVAAVDAMFAVSAAGPGAADAPDTAVAVALAGNTLTLRHGATALTLTRAATQPDAWMTRASASAPDSATCSNGQGFALSIAADAPGASSPEAALQRFLTNSDDLGLTAYDPSAWTIRHTSANEATATTQRPQAVVELIRLVGRGWFVESGHTCN